MKRITEEDVLAFLCRHPQKKGNLKNLEILDVRHNMAGRYLECHVGVSGGHLTVCFQEDLEFPRDTGRMGFTVTSVDTCFDIGVAFNHQKCEITKAYLFFKEFLKEWYGKSGLAVDVS